jgi:starvation-inducible DNA-binding protein
MKTKIGLSDKDRSGSIEILNQLLADEYVLYTKTRNYHWNVTGDDFSELHKFFEAQYEEIDEIIDEVAERARSLGGNSLGTLKEFLGLTRLKELPKDYPADKQMIARLLTDHESIIQSLRSDLAACSERYHDMGTSDFLTGLMEQHEKMAWMLRAYLE